jgi:hypothetical protein
VIGRRSRDSLILKLGKTIMRILSLPSLATFAIVAFFTTSAAMTPAEKQSNFKTENDAAMKRMMSDMAVKPSGDIDRDFAAMMIPHHQCAIDMARAELRNGSNEQLKRIAQEIIIDQQEEIVAMRLALGQPLPASAPAPTQVKRTSSSNPPPSSH